MRVFNAAYASYNFRESVEARYVFKIAFSDDSVDDIYIRSHDDVSIPGVTILDAKLSSISVTSQSLNLASGSSEIGKMSFSAIDVNKSLTDYQRSQINSQHSARWRDVEMYKGFRGLDWVFYEKQASQILNGVSYKAGEYRFQCRDILRRTREDVMEPIELRLSQAMGVDDTTVQIVSNRDTQGRILEGFLHDAGFSDRPGEKVAYVKVDDEIMSVAHSDIGPTSLTNVTRGALGTRPEEHTTGNNGKKLTEVVYLEGAFPRVAYGLLTGAWLDQDINEGLPAHWHAGIPGKYIKTSEFIGIGDDWITTNPAEGLPVEVKDPGKQDAKRYIEREICRVFSCFMPVDNNGALGLRRNQPVLSTAAPIGTITDSMLTTVPTIKYAMEQVVNDLRINYFEVDGQLTRTIPLVDQESIDENQKAPQVEFNAAILPGSRYSPEAISEILKRYRDRFGYPPLTTSVTVLGNGNAYEVGDVVRLKSKAALLYTEAEPTEGGILHSFEVQNVSHNPRNGTTTYKLFGTSREAGTLAPNFINFAVPDAAYISGTDGSTLPGVTDQGSHWELPNGLDLDGEYYWDKDVIIPSGNTVTYNNTSRINVRGVLSCLGKLDGKGRGYPGASSGVDLSGIPQFGNGVQVVPSPPATTPGTPGFLGTTQADGSLIERTDKQSGPTGSFGKYHYWGQSVQSTITQGLYNEMPSFYVRMDGGSIVGLPSDLRGTSGGGGGYRAFREADNGTIEDLDGGAGGAGGASLVVLCRGMTFGAGGELDCSGEDGQPGVLDETHELPAFSTSGAGGAPGGVLCAIDGALSPVPQKFGHVTADYGDSPDLPLSNKLDNAFISVGDTSFGTSDGAQVPNLRVSFFESGTQGVQLGGGAFRSVYVVPEYTEQDDGTDASILKKTDISLSVTEAFDDRDDPNVTLLKASVTRNTVTSSYSAAAIYTRILATQNWFKQGFAEDDLDFDLPADGKTYEVQARPVLINGVESDDGVETTQIVTDSNIISAVPDSLEAVAAVELVSLKARVPRTGGKPDFINIYRSTTSNDASPGFVKSEPVFYVPAPTNAWCSVDVTDATVTGGTDYYYWVTSVNEQGESAIYPTGTGISVTPQDNAGGAPGTPGQDAISGETVRLEINLAAGVLSKTSPQVVRLSYTRGGATVSTHDVTVDFDASGVISMVGAHVFGEQTGTPVSPEGIGTPTAKYTSRHISSDKRAYLDVAIISDGKQGPQGLPGTSRSYNYDNAEAVAPPGQGAYGFSTEDNSGVFTGTFDWPTVRSNAIKYLWFRDRDSDGQLNTDYYTKLVEGDTVVWYQSTGRWVAYRVRGARQGADTIQRVPVSLLGFSEEDGGFDINPSGGIPVELRFSRVVDGKDGENGKSVEFQFSVDGLSNWHDVPNPGVDKFIRFRQEGGEWGEGQPHVGEDGNSVNYIFRNSQTEPARPTGNSPAGWLDEPDGTAGALWWVSYGSFNGGELRGQWSRPVQQSGTDGSSIVILYRNSQTKPTRPTGNSPSGWVSDTTDTAGAIWWVSQGSFLNGSLVGIWSNPVRLSGLDGPQGNGIVRENVPLGTDGTGSLVFAAAGGQVSISLRGPVQGFSSSSTGPTSGTFTILRNGASIGTYPFGGIQVFFDSELGSSEWFSEARLINVELVDTPAEGNHTYSVAWSASPPYSFFNGALVLRAEEVQ